MNTTPFNYYITDEGGKRLEWCRDAYTAAVHANAKADYSGGTYYVHNVRTGAVKAYTGYKYNNTRLSRFNYYLYVVKPINDKLKGGKA